MNADLLLTPSRNLSIGLLPRRGSVPVASPKCILRKTSWQPCSLERSASDYQPRPLVKLDRFRSEFTDRTNKCITFRDDAVPLRGNPDGSVVLAGGNHLRDGSCVVFHSADDQPFTLRPGTVYYLRGCHPAHWVYENPEDPCGSVVDLSGADFAFGSRLVEANSASVDDLKHQRAQVRRKLEQAGQTPESGMQLHAELVSLTSEVRRRIADQTRQSETKSDVSQRPGCAAWSWDCLAVWLARTATGPSPVLSVGVYS